MAQYLDGFKRMTGANATSVTLSEYQSHFVRPSVSGPVSRRVFRALVGFHGADDKRTPALDVHDFVRGIVSLCNGDADARMNFAFLLFADASGQSIDERSFVSLWAPTLMLSRTLGFKLRVAAGANAMDTDKATMLDFVKSGQTHFHEMAQKKPDALRFRDFAVWCDRGNNEVLRFLAWAVRKSAVPDYKLAANDMLVALRSSEAKIIGGTCDLLTSGQLNEVCAHLPSEIAPPSSCLLPLYSTARNGFSMTTLIALHEKAIKNKKVMHHGLLFIVKTTDGETFGAFASSPFKLRTDHAHGDARESFVFSAHEKADDSTPAFVRIYGARDSKHEAPCLFYVDDPDLAGGYGVAIGGRSGFYGILLDGSLVGGTSNVTQTFGGEPLVTHDSDGKFKVASLEAFVPAYPVDETREPLVGDVKEGGVLEQGAEAMFILELIGQGYSQTLS